MRQLTEDQWYFISTYATQPCELHEGDLTGNFLYDREFGFFNVEFAGHEGLICTLEAFHQNLDCCHDILDKLNTNDRDIIVDMWLKRPGSAFKSAVSKDLRIGYSNSLNAREKLVFKNFKIRTMLND